jgi:hypothetical protein
VRLKSKPTGARDWELIWTMLGVGATLTTLATGFQDVIVDQDMTGGTAQLSVVFFALLATNFFAVAFWLCHWRPNMDGRAAK